ncbi:MAG TPA: patatin-like phospholipase family protein, partial [Plasticicumulans sp.]|nr:patatin-like phospholipase family protein [Plasticicumulans sp.]
MADDTRDTPTPPPATGPAGSALHAAIAEYGVIALVLQGGGALGSYQGGVAQGLLEAGVEPNWVAGISIGALNAAIIAGNPPERRLERLQAFWDAICAPQWLPASWAVQWPQAIVSRIDGWPRSLANAW